MANAFYDLGLSAFARGEIDWESDTIKVVLVDLADYTPDLDADEFLADVPSGARVATATLASAAVLAGGVLDAADTVLAGVTGDPSEALVIYKDTGSAATSPLLIYIDSASGLTLTPNGEDVTINWPSGTSRIAKL